MALGNWGEEKQGGAGELGVAEPVALRGLVGRMKENGDTWKYPSGSYWLKDSPREEPDPPGEWGYNYKEDFWKRLLVELRVSKGEGEKHVLPYLLSY